MTDDADLSVGQLSGAEHDALAPIEYATRPDAVRHSLAERYGLEAVVATDPVTLRWVTGFTGSTGWLVIDANSVVLGVDARYCERARDDVERAGLAPQVEVTESMPGRSRRDEIAAALGESLRCGARAAAMTHAEWSSLSEVLHLVAVDGLFEDLRRAKDAGELARIGRAAEIAEVSLSATLGLIDVGTSEMDMRIELEYQMRRRGADDAAYPTIVASGPLHSARPHHGAGVRRFEAGDLVVIDVGALVDGYRSDMTRTFVIGEPTPAIIERYQVVSAAQAAGLGVIGPGVAASAIDAQCRQIIADAGFGDDYLHIAGHGVGLEIHELPFHSPRSDDVLRVGDVVTVEPGVYRVGLGGIRIEDLVAVTEHGYAPLTSFPKDSPCLPSPPTT